MAVVGGDVSVAEGVAALGALGVSLVVLRAPELAGGTPVVVLPFEGLVGAIPVAGEGESAVKDSTIIWPTKAPPNTKAVPPTPMIRGRIHLGRVEAGGGEGGGEKDGGADCNESDGGENDGGENDGGENGAEGAGSDGAANEAGANDDGAATAVGAKPEPTEEPNAEACESPNGAPKGADRVGGGSTAAETN